MNLSNKSKIPEELVEFICNDLEYNYESWYTSTSGNSCKITKDGLTVEWQSTGGPFGTSKITLDVVVDHGGLFTKTNQYIPLNKDENEKLSQTMEILRRCQANSDFLMAGHEWLIKHLDPRDIVRKRKEQDGENV